MPHFEIPDSIRAYFREPATKSVVDALVPGLGDPVLPDTDQRTRLKSLNEGVVLACQVRAEMVSFLAGIWETTFGHALQGRDLKETFPQECTISEIWTERHFWSYVANGPDLERQHFDLTVSIDDTAHSVTLYIWRYDGDTVGKFSPRQKAPEGWKLSRDDNDNPHLEVTSDVPILELLENPEESVARLRDCASTAVDFICQQLRSAK